MHAKIKPLEIFLFTPCEADVCSAAHKVLVAHLKTVAIHVSTVCSTLQGQEVNIILCDRTQIRKLNRQFRQEDRATDVLSFPLTEPVAGEVWISPGMVKKNAREFGEVFEKELVRVLVHGLLHLGGMDHDRSFRDGDEQTEEMFSLQERVLRDVFSAGA